MKVAKITGLNGNNNTYYKNSQPAFQAHARRMPFYKELYNSHILFYQYDHLARSKHYEALDDFKFPFNKNVRAFNYSFLENIPEKLKKDFLEIFERITGFPNKYSTCNKMRSEFIESIKNCDRYSRNVIAAGYSPINEVELYNSLPGGPLDRGFVILKSNKDPVENKKELIDMKRVLWENVDQRILSFNHKFKFPEVWQDKKIYKNLDILDELTKKSGLDKQIVFYRAKRDYDTNPLSAGEFNIKLAQFNDESKISKEEAKNFAYFIEAVRDGKVLYPTNILYNDALETLLKRMKASPFAQMSNVTQMTAFTNLYNEGLLPLAAKYKYRDELPTEYYHWTQKEKFDFIKDLVKYVTDEQSSKYEKYFKDDDNRAELFGLLNKELLK